VLAGAFEKVVLPESSFDLVYAATALHWIDPAFRFVKPHKLLKQGGYLAIIHTHHVSDDRGDAFSVAAKAIYKKYRDDYDPTFTLPSILNIKPLVVDQIDTKLFELTFFKAFPKQLYYSADEYIQLLGTFSDTIAMPDNNRVPFLQSIKSLIEDEFGGGIVKHFAMSLTVARKI
jgi:trans-aconitate methyltransferase